MALVNWWVQAADDWEDALIAVWPEITEWEHAQDIRKCSWQERYQAGGAGGLAAPWAIVYTPEWMPATGGGTPIGDDWLEGEVTFYYFALDTTDIITTLFERTNAMMYYLRTTQFPCIQVRPGIRLSTGPQNEANQQLSAQKLPISAGGVTWKCRLPGPTVQAVG